MVGALFAASYPNLQTGFIAADSGFTVPYPDGEVKIGTGDVIDFYWTYEEDLNAAGFTDYSILIMVNGQGFENVFNGTVSGYSVYYMLDGSDYNNKDVIVVRMLIYSPILGEENEPTGEFDITWDDVIISILGPFVDETTTTTTTTTTTRTTTTSTGEEVLITILMGTGLFFGVMVIGLMFRRKRK